MVMSSEYIHLNYWSIISKLCCHNGVIIDGVFSMATLKITKVKNYLILQWYPYVSLNKLFFLFFSTLDLFSFLCEFGLWRWGHSIPKAGNQFMVGRVKKQGNKNDLDSGYITSFTISEVIRNQLVTVCTRNIYVINQAGIACPLPCWKLEN